MEIALQRVQELVCVIRRIGDEVKKDYPMLYDRCRRHVVDSTEQSPIGIFPASSHIEDFERPIWHNVYAPVLEKVKLQPEFNYVILEMQRLVGSNPKSEQHTSQAIGLLIGDYLSGNQRNLTDFIEILKKNIKEEPVFHWTEMELRGFEICIPRVEISVNGNKFIFRQPQATDFEKEISDYSAYQYSVWDRPSCFLRIEMCIVEERLLQLQAMRAEVLLRLFDVCSCTKNRQSFHSVSVARFFGGTLTGAEKQHVYSCQLKAECEPYFKHFWSVCFEKIIPKFVDFSTPQEDYFQIAYARYCDALFQVGRAEGKIAFAIMGLEAIYLSREKEELKLRLSLRIAKVFGKMGFDAEEMSTWIRAGYDIRSAYVHGCLLSAKERRQHEGKTKLTLEALSLNLLNSLRLSLLLVILTNQDKNNLLELLEGSFLNDSKDKRVEEIIRPWKQLLNPPSRTEFPDSVPS